MKDKFDYFKPCVQVEMENPDKQETVTDVFIRGKMTVLIGKKVKILTIWLTVHCIHISGWKVDESIMSVLNQSLPKLNNLKSLT